MTAERTRIKKLHETLEQAIREMRALRKCTKETQVIFLQALEAHEKTAKMMRNLLEGRLILQEIYGK